MEALFAAFASLEDSALVLIDEDGKINNWSPGAQKLYGYSDAEILGKPFNTLFPEEARQLVVQHLRQIISLPSWREECHQRRKDGSHFPATITYSCIHDSAGEISGFLALCSDLPDQNTLAIENRIFRERLEQEVAQRTRQLQIANEELEAFSYSVSHDLRAPLRAINGFSQVLIEQFADKLDAEGLRLLQIVHWNAELMGQLIDDLLKFSRLSKLNVIGASVDMNAIVKKALAMLITPDKAGRYKIDVNTLHPCVGDDNMLLQVWMNLIDNALKYTSKTPDPHIVIGSSEGTSTITYYIKDNGAGFDMRYADKLFGVFQRLHSHEEFSGTGLGLALIKRIISKHGGEIKAHAELNKGAEFHFQLKKTQHEHTS